jgi:hypothetical protein
MRESSAASASEPRWLPGRPMIQSGVNEMAVAILDLELLEGDLGRWWLVHGGSSATARSLLDKRQGRIRQLSTWQIRL